MKKEVSCAFAKIHAKITMILPFYLFLFIYGHTGFPPCTSSLLLFSAELKPRGHYLELLWQPDLAYMRQAIIGVKVPNSGHMASIQH